MFIAIENIVDKAVDDRGLANSLIAKEDNFVFEKRRDRPAGKV